MSEDNKLLKFVTESKGVRITGVQIKPKLMEVIYQFHYLGVTYRLDPVFEDLTAEDNYWISVFKDMIRHGNYMYNEEIQSQMHKWVLDKGIMKHFETI